MKNLLLTALIIFSIGKISAQSPIINDFRKIITERTNGFKSLQQDLLQDNTEKKVKIYNPSVGQSSICKAFITQSETHGATFILVYNVESMDAMKLQIFNNMAQQYITELNDMVKSGNYKGRDYNDGEDSITEVTDLDGKVVAQYVSNTLDHMILVFGA